jgi:hypothetical protein
VIQTTQRIDVAEQGESALVGGCRGGIVPAGRRRCTMMRQLKACFFYVCKRGLLHPK